MFGLFFSEDRYPKRFLIYEGMSADAAGDQRRAEELQGEIEFSPVESEAYRGWSRSQIEAARARYNDTPELALGWESDELYPEENEEA